MTKPNDNVKKSHNAKENQWELIENLRKMMEFECSRRCDLEDKINKAISLIKDGRFVEALQLLEEQEK